MILHQFLDYETLRLIWWVLLGTLLIGFAITDGFDLGIGTLLPFVAKSDMERRIVINTIGPIWEGNQVWLIVGGGVIFAAWPPLYAVSFSGFYLAMFVILASLIIRPVAFKYRSKRESATWRSAWDWALFTGGFVPALIFGVAVGNVLQGVPFRFNNELRIFYEGTFFGLLNPFALLCGVLSVAMLIMHGSAWLMIKTSGPVADKARRCGMVAAPVTVIIFVLAGFLLWSGIDGYRITSVIDKAAPSNPLLKTVVIEHQAWFANYAEQPWLLAVPVLAIVGAFAAFFGLKARREGSTMLLSGLSVASIIATVGVSMFPIILPSSLDPRSSLTVWDASSSHLTLFIMLVVSAIFIPLIVAYTSWVYKVLWGKVDETMIGDKSGHAY
ncbi:cytochrome d ubiquinol oxidase subunit II [Phyllobacterium sp. YR531]|uniref:cytochrome d ubiquinol oxidase subunit II n=1 Tax=Phyllobacterium sp. YR531 TaxID=1144343 RepID=UPI00026FB2A7|nr:cytochrome d ubiquinol oxidase subunit II [Phyllobacterium sp. YR531]EJN00450.1 cytochrome d oxidase cyd, subunit II [Phyllobacterium sp. YR531]